MHAEGVASKECVVVGNGDVLVTNGDDLVAEGVYDAPTVVAAHRGKTIGERVSVLEDRGEDLAAEGIDEGVEDKEGVDDDTHSGVIVDKGTGVEVLDWDDYVAVEVSVSSEVVF